MLSVSPFAPESFPEIAPVAGVSLAVAESGIRYRGRPDLLLVEFTEGTQSAGVLTRSLCASAPVEWCRQALSHGEARALIVNAGNANAFTGKKGRDTVEETVGHLSRQLHCAAEAVYVASTGVIGEPLPSEKITALLPKLESELGYHSWEDAARAIGTTDTFPKGACRTAMIGDTEITLSGIIKGSGMIAPDMATMLGFIFTDAALPAPLLQTLLSEITEESFNCITVDSDTSTSDTVLLFATGKAQHPAIHEAADPGLADFRRALRELCIELAQWVVKDGEGISKFITVEVTGASSDVSARRVAKSIADSPLVKTAIAGEDPNWGRIVMAVGKAGEPADRDKLAIRIGETQVTQNGMVAPDYDEKATTAPYMKERNVRLAVDLGVGTGTACVWACDLTHDYISINADYRS